MVDSFGVRWVGFQKNVSMLCVVVHMHTQPVLRAGICTEKDFIVIASISWRSTYCIKPPAQTKLFFFVDIFFVAVFIFLVRFTF